MKARVIIGANYGDEGKGTVVARYTKAAIGQGVRVLNILTNGGAQRSHTVTTKYGDVTFQHFGSGTYHGADSYYSRFFILNPVQFAIEHKALIIKPAKVYRDRECRWSTIYDMMANKIEAELTGTHASCCMGIWNTVQRFSPGILHGAMYFDEFMCLDEPEQLRYLTHIRRFYERTLPIPDGWRDIWYNPQVALHFIEDCRYMFNHTIPVSINDIHSYDELIFENGQGLMLCDRGANTSDTTPSHTGSKCALKLITEMSTPENPLTNITLHYVSRTYLTRHGDGNLPDEHPRGIISSSINEDSANHYNENQGDFRYGKINYDELAHRVNEDAGALFYLLELTHCDEVDNVEEAHRYFENLYVIPNYSPLVV